MTLTVSGRRYLLQIPAPGIDSISLRPISDHSDTPTHRFRPYVYGPKR